jgi:hypothetical protein
MKPKSRTITFTERDARLTDVSATESKPLHISKVIYDMFPPLKIPKK